MYSTARDFTSDQTRCQPQTENPLASLLRVATDTSLSCEARLLYVVLCLMAWSRGYCWPSLATLGSYLGRSDDSVSAYHKELQAAGLLLVERSRRRSNRYYPATLHERPQKTPTGSQSHEPRTRVGSGSNPPLTRTGSEQTLKPKKEQKNVENVLPSPTSECAPTSEPVQSEKPSANENVIFTSLPENQEPRPQTDPLVGGPSPTDPPQACSQSLSPEKLPRAPVAPENPPKPQPAPFDLPTVLEIESLTGDRRSRGAWVQVVKYCHPETVRMALSATRAKQHEESGVNLGAYYLGCVRNLEPDFFFRKKGQKKQPPIQNPAPEAENHNPIPSTPVVSAAPERPGQTNFEPACLSDFNPEEQERRRKLGLRSLALIRARLCGKISQQELEACLAEEGEGEQKT
jgi:hypothetical protein